MMCPHMAAAAVGNILPGEAGARLPSSRAGATGDPSAGSPSPPWVQSHMVQTQWAELGAGGRVDKQPQTQQAANQDQGPSREPSQGAKGNQAGGRTGEEPVLWF